MNVNDFKAPEQLPEDTLIAIFKHQHDLAGKYLDIEEANGLLQTRDIPVNIHDKLGQARIKDEFWRVTEEVCEALEALDEEDLPHFHEELADAMHFFVEACVLSNFMEFGVEIHNGNKDTLYNLFWESHEVQPQFEEQVNPFYIHRKAMCFIKELGLAANCLKNKPWKQSHVHTDEAKYRNIMSKAFRRFIDLCKASGFSWDGLYNMYMCKYEVNKFRQNSGY
ncbi:MAG: hypothetical protein HF312_17240 [Ignavibacteria bacterium]|jgi:hypothetical protein|nr:hypothetical protein [Ignavibacteria bacterium]